MCVSNPKMFTSYDGCRDVAFEPLDLARGLVRREQCLELTKALRLRHAHCRDHCIVVDSELLLQFPNVGDVTPATIVSGCNLLWSVELLTPVRAKKNVDLLYLFHARPEHEPIRILLARFVIKYHFSQIAFEINERNLGFIVCRRKNLRHAAGDL